MNAVIFGRRRQGKSTLSLALAVSTAAETIIVFDPNNQYQSLERVSPADLESWLQKGNTVCRIDVIDPVTDFEDTMEVLDGGEWRFANYAIVIDESSFLQKPQRIHPEWERLMRQSPRDVHLIQNTHRAPDTHNLVRALASDVFVFQTYLRRDLNYLAENFGDDMADAVARLPKYHVIHWWLDEGGVPQWREWRNPDVWYVDIGRKD